VKTKPSGITQHSSN